MFDQLAEMADSKGLPSIEEWYYKLPKMFNRSDLPALRSNRLLAAGVLVYLFDFNFCLCVKSEPYFVKERFLFRGFKYIEIWVFPIASISFFEFKI